VNAKTGRLASSTDRETWSSFGQAIAAYMSGRFEGISFAFPKWGGMFGIDLDACISPDGEIAPWAEEILEAFPTYAEVSPSGTGIKMYGLGNYNATGINFPVGEAVPGQKRSAIELCGWGKFFAFTGRVWPGHEEVQDCSTPLAVLSERIKKPEVVIPKRLHKVSTPVLERARTYVRKIPPAISGQGGHNKAFYCACRLIGLFGLDEEEAMDVMQEWNETCVPPWTPRELTHKIKDAIKIIRGTKI
jgi:hypothetical protein